jgi:hypothetical protein
VPIVGCDAVCPWAALAGVIAALLAIVGLVAE